MSDAVFKTPCIYWSRQRNNATFLNPKSTKHRDKFIIESDSAAEYDLGKRSNQDVFGFLRRLLRPIRQLTILANGGAAGLTQVNG